MDYPQLPEALLCILSLSMLLSVLTACSKKNGMVKELFADFGFEKQSDTDGNTVWMLKTAGYTNKNRYIDVPQEETDA